MGDRTENWKKRCRIREKAGEAGLTDRSAGGRAAWQAVMEGLPQGRPWNKGPAASCSVVSAHDSDSRDVRAAGRALVPTSCLAGVGQGVLNDGLYRRHPNFPKEVGMP